MGAFKTVVRKAFGPSSPQARFVLDAADRLRRPLTDPLHELPVPLLDPDRSLLVVWAAKCACSLTFVWYLKSVGLFDHYSASGMSPHEYRGHHYLTSDAFKRGKAKLLDDYYVIHVIRDPFLRAVSSYRHVLATDFADKRFRTFDGGALNRHHGFSFNRYLDFLETLDLGRTNLHHRLQLHRLERIKRPDRVINISKDSLLDELNRLEDEHAIPRTDFSKLDGVLGTEERRRAKTTTFRRDGVADLPLNVAAARGQSPWPDYGQFLTAPVRRRIETLYATDFEAFGPYL